MYADREVWCNVFVTNHHNMLSYIIINYFGGAHLSDLFIQYYSMYGYYPHAPLLKHKKKISASYLAS
jgi:hypothetical protein